MTLNRELVERWVEDLRSGKYRQGKKTLRAETENGYVYCCLGVACETAGLNWDAIYDGKPLSEHADPPLALINMLGLSDDTWSEGEDGDLAYTTCEKWNDSDGLSFDEIADNLEKHLANE